MHTYLMIIPFESTKKIDYTCTPTFTEKKTPSNTYLLLWFHQIEYSLKTIFREFHFEPQMKCLFNTIFTYILYSSEFDKIIGHKFR